MARLTLKQLNKLFTDVTASITGLDSNHIRLARPSNGQPFSEQNENCAFIRVEQIASPMSDATFTEVNPNTLLEGTIIQSYTRVMQCKWVFYGPDAYDLCDTIRAGILNEALKRPLTQAQIYPVTAIPAPTQIPENINGQWWERSDVKVQFNVATTHEASVPYLSGASIILENEQGIVETIQVSK